MNERIQESGLILWVITQLLNYWKSELMAMVGALLYPNLNLVCTDSKLFLEVKIWYALTPNFFGGKNVVCTDSDFFFGGKHLVCTDSKLFLEVNIWYVLTPNFLGEEKFEIHRHSQRYPSRTR